ncbi:MAG: hypothetical protein JST79_14785 [Acidobacteria bacterium]|nr:hypothetical protein [Acidobacteriota bacterium]
MPISAVDTISPALQHTKQQLFRPFRFGQWNRLALVGVLAGELSSGGSCNVPSSFQTPRPSDDSQQFLSSPGLDFPKFDLHALLWALPFILLAALVLAVLFLYLNSRMRFVLFDSIVAKECRIREFWGRRGEPAFQFFLWQIGIAALALVTVTILVGIPLGFALLAGWLQQPKEHLLPLILGGIVLFLVVLTVLLTMFVVSVLTKDFVVPQMALENIGALEAWRRLLAMLRSEKGGYAGYLGMKVVLAIAASIAVAIVSVIVFLILAIPVGVLGVAAVLSGKAAGMTWDVYTISLAIVAGSIALAVFLYILGMICVPVSVFFPAYSYYFFAERYPRLHAALFPPAAHRPAVLPPPPFSAPPEPIG